MLVLALDTSSAAVVAGVVAVDADTLRVVAERAPVAPRGHGELLSPAVAECLAAARCRPADICAVVAGTGPGPFTGLRVGLVTAAAFADAIGAPAYGVCSLDAIAHGWDDAGTGGGDGAAGTGGGDGAAGTGGGDGAAGTGELLVVTDARRHELYWARYGSSTGSPARTMGPGVARPAEIPVDGVAAVAGAGADLYAETWPRGAVVRAARHPSAEQLVACARERILRGARSEPLTPLYLRRPDAVPPGLSKPVSRGSTQVAGR